MILILSELFQRTVFLLEDKIEIVFSLVTATLTQLSSIEKHVRLVPARTGFFALRKDLRNIFVIFSVIFFSSLSEKKVSHISFLPLVIASFPSVPFSATNK